MATQFAVDFTCPISLEIVSDLVILSSGHTFDRASIQRWLDAGHRTCPISKLPLPDHPSLIHNHGLRSLISTYTLLSPAKLHHQYHHHRQQRHSHSQPQTPISTLTSPASTLESKLDSPLQVPFRAKLTESGAISAVLNWVDS